MNIASELEDTATCQGNFLKCASTERAPSNRKLVVVPSTSTLVKKSPGFEKKGLADHKIDLLALCEFGCRYCSSNTGNYLRINRARFAAITETQLGERLLPADEPTLTFAYANVVEQLARELHSKPRGWGIAVSSFLVPRREALRGGASWRPPPATW
jgi:hypothetical protein